MSRTVFGRHVYAIGGNVDAATMSGVNTKRTDFLVMTNMGLLAGLAGLVTTARLTAANPKAGVNFELDAIAAAFIGGAAVTGGVGTVIGAIIGGLVMGVLNNGMSLNGVSIDWQQAIKGWCCWPRSRSTCGTRSGPRAAVVLAPRPPSRRRHHPTSSRRDSGHVEHDVPGTEDADRPDRHHDLTMSGPPNQPDPAVHPGGVGLL